MAVQPKCPLCGLDLPHLLPEDKVEENAKIKDSLVSYWMHDPRNLHVDVRVTAHKDCYDKIKAVHKTFDQPVEDYAVAKYPTLKDGKIILKSPTEFLKAEVIEVKE